MGHLPCLPLIKPCVEGLMRFFNRFLPLFFVVAVVTPVVGENWPGWRGPRGDGSSLDRAAPTRWNGETGENIAWKVPVAGLGHASPVVWRDRVFVVSCLTESGERILSCFSRYSGELLWQQTVLHAGLEVMHALNSFASGTPATDGERVYVAFLEPGEKQVIAPNVGSERLIKPGEIVVGAYDMEGQQEWLVRVGDFVSAHGFCSCPVLFQDMVIINGDHDGDSYLVALDKKTGEERWRTMRRHKIRSYVTPILREIDGQMQMVLSGSQCVASFNPQDGSRNWEIDGPTEQFVASMVYDGALFFMTCGFPDYHVMGIRPDGQGNVTDSHVAWRHSLARSYVPSPVVLNGFLLVADDRGTANCFDAKDGKVVWKKRLGSHYSASLVHANGLVYFLADNGITKVVRPGESLEVVAENPLGEHCVASPAISNGQLWIRSEHHLFCIGAPKER